jgi:hypothetical protein
LGHADQQRIPEAQLRHFASVGGEALGREQDDGADDEQATDDEELLAEERVDETLQRHTHERARDDARRQQDADAPIGVDADTPIAQDAEERGGVADEVTPEVHDQRRERAHVEHHRERRAEDELVVPAEDARQEDEMGRRRDRQELGQSLDDADDDGLEERVHQPRLAAVGFQSNLQIFRPPGSGSRRTIQMTKSLPS